MALEARIDDIIANEFLGDDAGQWIVDIKSSDLGFETNGDCGIWYNTPRAGAQAPVRSGMWLVGSQARSGTYRASTSSGCYWERLRNFSNTIGGVIANDFVSGGGSRIVSIRSSDAGFSTDDECGPWTRSSGLEPGNSRSDSTRPVRLVEELVAEPPKIRQLTISAMTDSDFQPISASSVTRNSHRSWAISALVPDERPAATRSTTWRRDWRTRLLRSASFHQNSRH